MLHAPSPAIAGASVAIAEKNPHPQLELHRTAAASDRLRVAEPRAWPARA